MVSPQPGRATVPPTARLRGPKFTFCGCQMPYPVVCFDGGPVHHNLARMDSIATSQHTHRHIRNMGHDEALLLTQFTVSSVIRLRSLSERKRRVELACFCAEVRGSARNCADIIPTDAPLSQPSWQHHHRHLATALFSMLYAYALPTALARPSMLRDVTGDADIAKVVRPFLPVYCPAASRSPSPST